MLYLSFSHNIKIQPSSLSKSPPPVTLPLPLASASTSRSGGGICDTTPHQKHWCCPGLREHSHHGSRTGRRLGANRRPNRHKEAKRGRGAHHVLAQTAEDAVGPRALLDDGVAAKNEADAQAHYSAHHGAHFHCIFSPPAPPPQSASFGGPRNCGEEEGEDVLLSRVLGGRQPPPCWLGIEVTGGMMFCRLSSSLPLLLLPLAAVVAVVVGGCGCRKFNVFPRWRVDAAPHSTLCKTLFNSYIHFFRKDSVQTSAVSHSMNKEIKPPHGKTTWKNHPVRSNPMPSPFRYMQSHSLQSASL